MAIAFYCEDDDPKVLHGSQSYYATYGYNSYQQQHHQAAVVEHHPQQSQQHQAASVDGNNTISNSSSNCALHSSDTINTEGGSNSGVSEVDATASSNRQLMQVLHQVLYRYTMEGALSPAHTSCVFCNKIYYLFQLLY
ncbi:uncharacterized protein LOC129776732 [Toxorhynchites rutilus septentrionalis]|uniref:uncharacterized protein LOC129776732 n=1 Tax=Toxorhynchites rutilus septentrionalis TaxID=329112 RepID=UPI00247AF63B|nr:uncharacterized protein LOC129776732 [Toxorhynchites rutilus septentrionalis]